MGGGSLVTWQVIPTSAQGGASATRAVATGDWPLHNLDLANSRYSLLDQINTSNADKLALKWSFELPNKASMSSATPVVVNGLMYFNSGPTIYALDAATGERSWTTSLPREDITLGGRGPLYANGTVYAFGRSHIYAVNAENGRVDESFGDKGVLDIARRVLDFKDPGKYPAGFDPESIGYMIASPATFADGTLYLGLAQSDSMIPGGFVVAIDGSRGRIKWVFRTVPQGPQDDGWEASKDTWSLAQRYGGGIWTQPAIDRELGLLYANVGNPSPNYDGSARKGINLFTNAIIALELATGKLRWHQQVIHHDIWDADLATGPTLFDVTINGRGVKGLASLAKTCYVYAVNRETGQPIFPLVETAVPTTTDVPGEQAWPTQPIPFTAGNVPQTPFCATYPPSLDDPQLSARRRQAFFPFQASEYIIISPGLQGGANRGSSSFSKRTGWLYVTGKNDAWSLKVKPVGSSLKPGSRSPGHFDNIVDIQWPPAGVTATQSIAAYDPATGELAWITKFPGKTNAGNLVTVGDVLFQEIAGQFYALDARSGKQLSKIPLKGQLGTNPLTYTARNRQYVALAGGSTVLAFGLP